LASGVAPSRSFNSRRAREDPEEGGVGQENLLRRDLVGGLSSSRIRGGSIGSGSKGASRSLQGSGNDQLDVFELVVGSRNVAGWNVLGETPCWTLSRGGRRQEEPLRVGALWSKVSGWGCEGRKAQLHPEGAARGSAWAGDPDKKLLGRKRLEKPSAEFWSTPSCRPRIFTWPINVAERPRLRGVCCVRGR